MADKPDTPPNSVIRNFRITASDGKSSDAEDQAKRRKQIFLADWQTKLDDFLKFNERAVLETAGKVSRDDADTKAIEQYDLFAQRRRLAAEDEALREIEAAVKKQTKGKSKKK